jgi:hypothetical protein
MIVKPLRRATPIWQSDAGHLQTIGPNTKWDQTEGARKERAPELVWDDRGPLRSNMPVGAESIRSFYCQKLNERAKGFVRRLRLKLDRATEQKKGRSQCEQPKSKRKRPRGQR